MQLFYTTGGKKYICNIIFVIAVKVLQRILNKHATGKDGVV